MDCKEFTWVLFCLIWCICWFVPSSEAYNDDNLFSDSMIVINNINNDIIRSRMAAFGPRISDFGDEGINGIVVPMYKLHEDEHDNKLKHGCRVATDEELNQIRNKEDGFIALVQRGGGCSFSAKVRNMQKSGAKAVIVGNNYGDIHLITMYASEDTSDIKIPSIFIINMDMEFLEQEVVFNNNSYGDVTILATDTDWPIADIFMMTTLLPIIFIFGIFILYKFRIETLEAELQAESSTSIGAATQEEVDALPIKVFSEEKKKENDPETCAVCIDDFKDGDKLRVLPCRHEYHVECIDLWLTTRKSFCPICKRCINDDDANENTPLLGRSTNNNSYNTDESSSSSSSSSSNNHVIDIDLEEEEEFQQPSEQDREEDHPTPQEEELIQSSDDEDNDDENEPLINLVTRS